MIDKKLTINDAKQRIDFYFERLLQLKVLRLKKHIILSEHGNFLNKKRLVPLN